MTVTIPHAGWNLWNNGNNWRMVTIGVNNATNVTRCLEYGTVLLTVTADVYVMDILFMCSLTI